MRGKNTHLGGVSLTLKKAATLSVVGESGAGKSTLIAAVLGLVKLSRGQITWDNAPVRACYPSLVMQEPRAAFNPRQSLIQSVREPLGAQRQRLDPHRLQRLCYGLEIKPEILERRPHEVSTGQAQRVGILRALISRPSLVLFDEPLSALDAVTQKHTAKLITSLQKEEGFSAMVVTHDLGYALAHSDEIAVLRSGHLEEIVAPHIFLQSPKTDYGRILRDAAFALGAIEKAA